MKNLFYSFNPGNYNITDRQLKKINSLVTINDYSIVEEFEEKFLKEIGEGYGISLASGRMAFYLLLKALNIGEGDEIIVVGFTCAVMINAILRVKATPIYSDVSPITFGSDPEKIKEKITDKTRMIVAQHSFGIPCEIERIVKIAKEKKIFVLEDSALALGSKINGINVGNFGDAAIFSTDHTKPLNTLIGGFFFTKGKKLFDKIAHVVNESKELTNEHKNNLFNELVFEIKWMTPERYRFLKVYNLPRRVFRKITGKKKKVFLTGEYGPPHLIKPNYPYPAKLPTFIAQLGIYELEYFQYEKFVRKENLEKILKIFENTKFKNDISNIYYQKNIEIIPLRFVLYSERASEIYTKYSKFIDFTQVWFKRPIIATKFNLEQLGYIQNNCPISEKIGISIINFPTILHKDFRTQYFNILKNKY